MSGFSDIAILMLVMGFWAVALVVLGAAASMMRRDIVEAKRENAETRKLVMTALYGRKKHEPYQEKYVHQYPDENPEQ